MRFSTAIVAGSFAVLASAASETSAAAQPASTSAVDQCIAKCPVADVNCKAHCIAVSNLECIRNARSMGAVLRVLVSAFCEYKLTRLH